MIRHDAHTDWEVFKEHGPEDPDLPGMDFPLPVQGNQSPNVLALGMIAKITFVYGIFILLIRLIGLSYPEVALILSYVFATAFAIAFGIKWLAPERGMMEWPVWLGAAVVMLFAANRYFPGSVLSAPVPPNPAAAPVVPWLFQAGIVLVIMVTFLSPAVQNLLSTKTRGPLALGAIGCLIGGRWAALGYVPESDFASWNFLAVMLMVVWVAIISVTDQYIRFEKATNPALESYTDLPAIPKCVDVLPVHHSVPGLIAVPIALWLGNVAFLHALPTQHANETGLLTFLAVLAGFCVVGAMLRARPLSPNPVLCAWNALTFWLTYNLQRNSNPNVFQCLVLFREPLVRFGVVGAAIMVLSLALLHLSGIHSPKGRNTDSAEDAFAAVCGYTTPQGYPKVVEKCALNRDAKVAYERWAEKLEGKAPLPVSRPVRTLGDLLYSAALFFLGGPLLFFFLLLTTQGNFLAAKVARNELLSDEP